jgi:hypothetical protein
VKADLRYQNGCLYEHGVVLLRALARSREISANRAGPTSVRTCFPAKQGQEEPIDLATLYDLSRPGRYTVQVIAFDPETNTTVKSNRITLVGLLIGLQTITVFVEVWTNTPKSELDPSGANTTGRMTSA